MVADKKLKDCEKVGFGENYIKDKEENIFADIVKKLNIMRWGYKHNGYWVWLL